MSKPSGNSTTMIVRSTIGPFDVRSPPVKKHKIAGHLVPTFRTATRFLNVKRRRIAIEILSPASNTHTEGLGEESSRMWDPENELLNDQDRVVFRVFRLSHKKQADHDDDNDDGDDEASAYSRVSAETDGDTNGKTWREHTHYRSDDVEILKVSGKTVEVKLGAGNETVVRDFHFESPQEATKFREIMEKIKALETERAGRQIAKYKSKKNLESQKQKAVGADGDEMLQSLLSATDIIEEGGYEDQINLLVEIVSARDLPVADIVSTDAYVVARMKGKEIDRTEVISNNLSPIWALETGSLFLVQMTPEEFFASTSGMSFVLKDFDAVGSNEILGSVNVPLEELLAGTGERIGYDIVPDVNAPKSDPEKTGRLFLRFKKAAEDDIEFMQAYRGSAKKFGRYADETFLPIRKQNVKFLRRQEKRGANREVLHRVKPGPDPDRLEDDAKWMTKDQIHSEALKPSTHWIEAGSGDIGKLYLEVIGCDKLPNMDATSLNFKDRTDAFVCAVFEDCVVNTDVIGDTLSPRWMPWCHRAFAFNIAHPSSDVFLGIFDHDPELSPLQLLSRATSTIHDPIGRLVINVSNFKPGTTYLLTYPLFYGELLEHRTSSRGTVTLRLRLEFPDMRSAIIRGMLPPNPTVVSVARHIDFEVANYATEGVVDDLNFSIKTLTRYIEELQSHEVIVEWLKEAAMVVWLWRGHFPVNLSGQTYMLPLHSMTAFVWGVLVSWNYDLLPSFVTFCVGWALLACNEQVRKHPSRWHSCPSYYDFLRSLLLNAATSETIASNWNLEEIVAYDKKVEEQQLRREEEKQKEVEHEETLQAELGREIEKAEAAEQLGGKDGGIFGGLVENPLKPHLYPIQQQLRQVVYALRIAKGVILWNEAYYSFWLVTFCFLVSAAAIWVPWGFILRWSIRLVVFVALGPWMAIVDKRYFKKNPDVTQEERDEELRLRFDTRYAEVLQSATNYFIRKERAIKLMSMKKYMFGKYHLGVPRFCEDLYDDLPLPLSSCAPVDPETDIPLRVEQCKFGQNLKGDMIPKREIQVAVADENNSGSGEEKKVSLFWKKELIIPENIPLLGDASKKKYRSVAVEEKLNIGVTG